jgi:hypothetical protein
MKRLFTEDERESYTDDGFNLSCEVDRAIRPIAEKYADMGFSIRDIDNIMTSEVCSVCLDVILEVPRTTPKCCCTTVCNCDLSFVNAECPIHNDNPRHNAECPIHNDNNMKINWEHQITLASIIAKEAHKGTFRNFGADRNLPYIVHPNRVAESLEDPLLKSAGYLHDVVEDTNITFQDLKDRGVCEEVIDVLKYVTKIEGENYRDFIARIAGNLKAMKLKVADLKDNLSSCPEGQMKDKYRLALWILEGEIALTETAND